MIDYWESIGRLLYDKELAEGLEKVLPKSKEVTHVTATTINGDSTPAVKVEGGHHHAVRTYMERVLTGKCLSLMAAGELIRTYSYPKSGQTLYALQDLIAKAEPLESPSTAYFIALGIVTIDSLFRNHLRNNGPNDPACVNVLGRLSPPEAAHIMSVVHDNKAKKVMDDFEIPWDHGCFARYMLYQGYVDLVPAKIERKTHLHEVYGK